MPVSQPEVTANLISANLLVANTAQKVLLVGQKTSSGSVISGSLTENIQNDLSENALFGPNSMAAEMVRNFKAINKQVRLDAIALDDGAGAAAVGTVAFTGTATETGTITVNIASATNYSFEVAITSGDAATAIGAALETLVNAGANTPVVAVNTTGSVALTAVNLGTYGNNFGLSIEGEVAGVSVVLTAFASGATDPTLTGVFDVVGDTRYQHIIWPYEDALTELTGFLDPRFNVSNNVLDGVGFTASVGTLTTELALANAENSQSLVIFSDQTETETTLTGPSIQEIPIMTAVQFVAISSLRLTGGANVSQFVISRNGALDSFGGAALASKPYFNTPFSLLPTIRTGLGWTDTQAEQLKTAGASRLGNNRPGNLIISDEQVTTYKTDTAGNPDQTFKFLNFVFTSSNIREFYVNNYRARFAQSRLTEGALIAGRDMANKELIEAFSTQLYVELSGVDFVLTQAGEASLVFFNDNLIVTLDLSTGLVTIIMEVLIVTQLREIRATIQIQFDTTG